MNRELRLDLLETVNDLLLVKADLQASDVSLGASSPDFLRQLQSLLSKEEIVLADLSGLGFERSGTIDIALSNLDGEGTVFVPQDRVNVLGKYAQLLVRGGEFREGAMRGFCLSLIDETAMLVAYAIKSAIKGTSFTLGSVVSCHADEAARSSRQSVRFIETLWVFDSTLRNSNLWD